MLVKITMALLVAHATITALMFIMAFVSMMWIESTMLMAVIFFELWLLDKLAMLEPAE